MDHQFIQFVQSCIPPSWKSNASGWISGNCPMCQFTQNRPDTKKRGGFKIDGNNIRYHCFNCKYVVDWNPQQSINQKLRKLLEVLGADTAEIQRFSLMMLDIENQLTFKKVEVKKKFTINWKETALPINSFHLFNECDKIPHDKLNNLLEYLSDRNLLHWKDWYYSNYRMYSKRVILPLRYRGKIVGYSARYIGTPPKDVPKYLVNHPTGFISNLDRQRDNRKYVLVTEGYLDAIAVDGVGIGTNTINEAQVDILQSLNKKIIVLPDKDKSGKNLIECAIANNWMVSFPPWENMVNDAASSANTYGRLFTVKSAIEFATDNATKAEVMMKTWCK